MDSINVEKILALRRYKQQQIKATLMFYPIVALICGIFCTSPFWLPSLYSSLKSFLCVSLPTILSFFFNVKSLFIIGNLIVIFLLGESKIYQGSETTCPQKINRVEVQKEKRKQEEKLVEFECKIAEVVKIEAEEVEKESSRADEEENEIGDDEEEIEHIEEVLECKKEEFVHELLSSDELHRRADDFIARVNMQIRFEADHELLLRTL